MTIHILPYWEDEPVGVDAAVHHVREIYREMHARFPDKPILIGTWADASWAIEFYRRNGFAVVPNGVKDRLLRAYWSIPQRQIETSVVLADRRWMEGRRRASADR